MTGIEPYLFLFLVITAINLVPAFMPPTWIVLALLVAQYHLQIFAVIFIGVCAATIGRVLLSLIARHFSGYFLHKPFFRNYNHLGTFLTTHEHITIPIVFGYMLSPISSASLFIMAGLARMKLRVIVLSFLLGRFVSYTFWVMTSHQVALHFEKLFEHTNSNRNAVMGFIISCLIIVLVGKINWQILLPLPSKGSKRKR